MGLYDKIYLSRITHIQNIPHILKYGITHYSSPQANLNFHPIGDPTLINTRKNLAIPNGKRLGDFIPFYFSVRTPMLYVIQNGKNNVPITPAQDIVYCITSVQKILEAGNSFVFSDGHAVAYGVTRFKEKSEISDIENFIDKKAIESRYWKDEKDIDLKRRKEAEFLIEGDIPEEAILCYAVFNELAFQTLISFDIREKKIIIKPQFYF